MRRTMLGILTALVLALTTLAAAPAPAGAAARYGWGHLEARDGVLRQGCHTYSYRYVVRPPEGDWGLETFIRDRRGRNVASGVALGGQDPKAGRLRFTLCTPAAPGRYTIRGKLSVDDGTGEQVEGWIRPVTFRLRRA